MPASLLADEASFYRAALLGGLLDAAQAIAWADALGELGPEHLTGGGFRIYAGLLRERWEAGTLTPGEIADVLYSLALYHSPPGMEDELKRFSYDFELAQWTDETEQTVEVRLRAFLNTWA